MLSEPLRKKLEFILSPYSSDPDSSNSEDKDKEGSKEEENEKDNGKRKEKERDSCTDTEKEKEKEGDFITLGIGKSKSRFTLDLVYQYELSQTFNFGSDTPSTSHAYEVEVGRRNKETGEYYDKHWRTLSIGKSRGRKALFTLFTLYWWSRIRPAQIQAQVRGRLYLLYLLYTGVLVVSCFMLSDALDSPALLLTYPSVPLASPITNILISTLL